MAFPFPDKTHGADACEIRFDRHVGCLEAWAGKERMVGWMLVGVCLGVAVWWVVGVCFTELAGEQIGRRPGLGYEEGNGGGVERGDGARRIGYQRFTDEEQDDDFDGVQDVARNGEHGNGGLRDDGSDEVDRS